jgi:hypothetical protein
MMRWRALVVALAIGWAGCAARRGSACEWPDEPSIALDLERLSQRRHVIADARAAEEIAIHHADVTRGRRSGRFAGNDEYRAARQRCFTALSATIAGRHHLQPAQVAAAAAQRDTLADALLFIAFAGLFAIAANRVARRLFERFPPDDWLPAVIAAVAATGFCSVIGVIAGGFGATLVEMVRLGDGHMSYRAFRLPWNEHWLLLFLAALLIFSVVSAIRWRRAGGYDVPAK